MPTPPPPLSSRLGDVRSSPVRDILELTQRAEVISFARRPAGARAVPRRAHRRRVRAHARADRRGARAAVLLDRGRPGAAGAAGRALLLARAGVRGRRAARDDGLAAGAGADRGGPARPRRRRARREPLLPRGAAVLRLRGRAPGAGAVRRGRASTPRRCRRSSPSTRRSSSTSSRRSRTRPAARCRARAARAWRRSPPSTACGSSRTTPTASCATTASRWRRSARTPAPPTAR